MIHLVSNLREVQISIINHILPLSCEEADYPLLVISQPLGVFL